MSNTILFPLISDADGTEVERLGMAFATVERNVVNALEALLTEGVGGEVDVITQKRVMRRGAAKARRKVLGEKEDDILNI